MADTARTTQRRPKDRKDQIARAAAESFSTLGYHAVSVENIATEVGVSAPALYRHYASKYDLFRVAVLALSQQLVDVTDIVADPAAGPAAALDQLIHALIDVALRNRESGGLYRWQARYLREADAVALLDQLRLVNQRLQQPLAELLPDAPLLHRQMLSAALLSVAGGITDHHLRATVSDITDLLTAASWALLHTDFPTPDNFASGARGAHIFTADAGSYEAVLHASMMLFHRNGYAETSVAQIAKAAGLRISSIYRYFPGKTDILSTALRRSSDRLSAELAMVNTNRSEPRDALTQLIDIYVATSFANPELAAIYYSEQIHLSPTDRALLRNVQRSTIDSWVGLLRSVRPELTATAARFLVHAAMGLVVDLGRLVHYDRPSPDPEHDSAPHMAYEQACVRTLMHAVLFGA
ncbi:TetR/AcrR family transcriptional regulator [Mycolicibacter heraklionensis]|uniref:TetR/AcrR family transcriptional regulator n=1 Tax=Mycolicibacter heraklionensis TaxID=512402 RepID=UPI0009EEA754|nr:TetR/AcrR family transcriptional regulator [Mycolicibacter heraklionensis]